MSDLMSKFNQGVLTSTDIDREFHPEFVSKMIVRQPKRKKFFSQHSNYLAMRENHGDVLTKIVHYPMLHPENVQDANLDATSAKLVKNVYKVIDDTTKVVTAVFEAEAYVVKANLDAAYLLNGDEMSEAVDVEYEAARVLAKAAAVADAGAGETVFNSAGAILYGDPSYGLSSGNIAELPEEGGVVNLMNSTHKLTSAQVRKYGIGHKYTVDSIKKGSLLRTVAQKISDVGEALADMKELQTMVSVVSSAAANALISSDNPATVTKAAMTFADVLDFDTFTALEQDLLKNDVPMDTTLVEGSTNIDTKVIQDTYIMYVGPELRPALRKIIGPDGLIAFTPLAAYKAGLDRKPLQGEFGVVGVFTICVDKDLVAYRGAGLEVDSVTDLAYGYADDAAYDAANPIPAAQERANRHTTTLTGKDYYDVFPMVVVGDDSFCTTGFSYDTVSAHHIAPRAEVHNDMHAQVGGVSARWSYGFLPYRPERIRCLEVIAPRV